MDLASFVGFPGKNGNPWWEENGNCPIARMVNIASEQDFRNSSIPTTDVILVSGLSFSDSSGSPIFLHQKGILMNSNDGTISINNPGYVPAKLIGIMSGHWWNGIAENDV